MIQTVEQLGATIGVEKACRVLSLPRSSLYRARQAPNEPPSRLPSPRALSAAETNAIRAILNSERFQDQSPREVYATLIDEGQYLCSYRTMYRILAEHAEIRERRNQLRHPEYKKPELLATRPNQLWSWDITKLRGTGEMDLLLSVCHSGCLQPLCRRLDDRRSGIRCAGAPANCRNL